MVSRTKFAWISNFVRLDGWFLIRCCIQSNGCLVFPLLNLLLILLLLSHLVTSTNTFTRWRGRRGGRNSGGRRHKVNFRVNWRLIFSSWRCTRLRRNHSILNQGGWKQPYWQANGKSQKGQCSHIWSTNISKWRKRTRIPIKRNSLIGGLQNCRHTFQPKIN